MLVAVAAAVKQVAGTAVHLGMALMVAINHLAVRVVPVDRVNLAAVASQAVIWTTKSRSNILFLKV